MQVVDSQSTTHDEYRNAFRPLKTDKSRMFDIPCVVACCYKIVNSNAHAGNRGSKTGQTSICVERKIQIRFFRDYSTNTDFLVFPSFLVTMRDLVLMPSELSCFATSTGFP